MMYNLGSQSKRDALQTWRKYVSYYHHVLDRMKVRIEAIHKRRLTSAFMRWRGKKDSEVLLEMKFETENMENDNQNLSNDLSVKKQIREKQKV